MPPRMTIASAVIETMISKLVGVSEPSFTANSAPPSEPIAPPIAKARSLYRVVLMPMASATCSSSRIAFHARPIRELGQTPRDEHREQDERQRQVVEVLGVSEAESRAIAASVMSRIPCAPPTSGVSQFEEIRIDDDLAEAERDDRQVVAAQAQDRGADQHPDERREQRPRSADAT